MTMPEGEKQKRKKLSKPWIIAISVVLIVAAVIWLVYFFWFRNVYNEPLDEPLDIQTSEPLDLEEGEEEKAKKEKVYSGPPLCGDVNGLTILVVGTDYREGDYEYGLADAIRIVDIDFTEPQVNVVALPRALLIEEPAPRLDVDAPILINQAYFFGTSGMGHYSGSGYGAGAMAETIQTNFDVTVDNYLVMDFNAFKRFISLIAPVKINLPESIYINESDNPYFPAGVQYLTAEQALTLARARAYTSDNVRIDNQSILLKAIFERLKEPEVLLQLSSLIEGVREMVLTDLSLKQIQSFLCLIEKIDSNQVQFFNPGDDLIENDREFIPSMDKEMEIFRWDQDLVDWLHDSLWAVRE